ncbi:MAG: hypothetical protein EOO43_18630, partial [Flavobacterium sp.]
MTIMSKFEKSEIDLRKSHTEIETECGYCKGSGFIQAAYTYNNITPEHYTHLVNQGWCRYGDYYYKPNVEMSCCKIFAHRLDITQFTLRPSQKKAIKKWENFLINDKNIPSKTNQIQKAPNDSIIINIFDESRQEERKNTGLNKAKSQEISGSMHHILNIPSEEIILQKSIEELLGAITAKVSSVTQRLPMRKIGKLGISDQAQQKIKLLKANSRKYGEYST